MDANYSPEILERIKSLYREKYQKELTDTEVLDVADSLLHYAKAKHRYLLIKNGLISKKKSDNVQPKKFV